MKLREMLSSIMISTVHTHSGNPDPENNVCDSSDVGVPASLAVDASEVRTIVPGSACDRHFKGLPTLISQNEPTCWEHMMFASTALRETYIRGHAPCNNREFEYAEQADTGIEQDSRFPSSDEDEDYLTETDLSEPAEENLDTDEASGYESSDEEGNSGVVEDHISSDVVL